MQYGTPPGSLPGLKAGFASLAFYSLLLTTPCKAEIAAFENTGNLTSARTGHTATLLPEGKVLAAGGQNTDSGTLNSAELYDPADRTWAVSGSMITSRTGHTATLLPDGTVLVAGGDHSFQTSVTAELYDPATGGWTATGSLNGARISHTATLLPNGLVLVVGGSYDDFGYQSFSLDTAELYDPASRTWMLTESLPATRSGHTATLLPDGNVLVAGGGSFSSIGGGDYIASAELYDSPAGTWSTTGSLNGVRTGHTATTLSSGKVLVAGGIDHNGFVSTAEVYDPGAKTWTTTGNLITARAYHTATLLPDGRVLLVGGENPDGFIAGAELYNPESGTWSATATLNTARAFQSATLLPDSSVLIAGGIDNTTGGPPLESTELYVQSATLLNISTRLSVQTGDNVMIGGFIVTGTGSQAVIVRGLGPSLGVTASLSDPIIELHDSTGALLATNDNWKDDANQQQVVNSGLGPTNELESALWTMINPGAYTVILKGKSDGTGVGLVEVYQVGEGSDAQLANISTRGLVQTDDNVLIGGVIVGRGTGDDSANILIRALGPSVPVAGTLSDPTLELHDSSGTLIDSNDDWKTRADGSSQQAEIEATTIPPNDDLESALLETLSPGNYTAIVRGKDDSVGVGMVEIYNFP